MVIQLLVWRYHHHNSYPLLLLILCSGFLGESLGSHHHHRSKGHHSHYFHHYHHGGEEATAAVESEARAAAGTLGDVWGSKDVDVYSGRNPIPNDILPGDPIKPFPSSGQEIFLSENCTVVLAQVGSTPILHCEVADIGEGTVSWIRRKDYHLLTVGLATYSSDDRFFTAHVRNPQDWALHVRYARARDGGLYECQVSTHPPSSLFVELQLVEARAEILGAPDKFVKSGSSLRLTCLLRKSTEPPVYVFWYHEDRMINYDLGRGVRVRHGRYSSELVIPEAHKHDSGNYSCVPSKAHPASISVHILNGEEPAAMQHGSKSTAISLQHHSDVTLMCMILTTLVLLMDAFLSGINIHLSRYRRHRDR